MASETIGRGSRGGGYGQGEETSTTAPMLFVIGASLYTAAEDDGFGLVLSSGPKGRGSRARRGSITRRCEVGVAAAGRGQRPTLDSFIRVYTLRTLDLPGPDHRMSATRGFA